MEKIMEEVTSIEGNKNREKRTVQGLPNTHTDCPEHVFQLLDCIFQISALVSRFSRFSRLVHSISLEAFGAMPPRKSKDKEVQPAQVEHADDSPCQFEGENDPITFLPVSPLAKRSYGNPVFKEKKADRGGDFAESSNMFRGMMERLDLAFKEKNQTRQRLVESQAESSRRQEEIFRQCMEDMRRVFEEGTRVMRETGEESRRTLQAVSEQVVEQVRQPRPEIPLPVVEMPKQIQEAPSPALGGEGNQPYPNIQQQNFFMGEGQRQHEPIEAAAPVADRGHQPQHRYVPLGRRGNNQPAQFFNRDHGPALRPLEKIDKDILRFPNKAKETMGVDADPFPAVSVGMNVADLRSVARNRSLPYTQRNLAAEDLRIIVTKNFSPEGARRYSTGTRSLRMVKPPLKSPSRWWEKVSHPKFPTQNPRTLRRRLQRKRAEKRKRQQQQMEVEGSSSRRPRQPIKRNMVWVASVIVSPDGVLKATFEAQEQSGNRGAESKEDGTIHFGEFLVNLSCLVLTLPLVFQAKKEEEPIVCEFPEQTEEEVIVVPAQDDEEEDMADKIVFEKPEEKMARHIRPLYINAHMDETLISRVLVDNGVAVNVLLTCMLYKIGKSLDDLVHTEVTISDFTGGVNCSRGVLLVKLIVGNRTLMSAFFVVDTVATYNALLGRDWIHLNWCVPSSLHQKLIFWNGGKAEVVSADDKPFLANTHLVEARYYEEDIGTIRFFGMDRHGKPIRITACSRLSLSKCAVEEEREKVVLEITKKLATYFAEKAVQVDRSEIVYEGEEADRGDEITLEELDLAPAKLDDLKAEVQDPLEEINLGSESEPKVTFISGSLEPQTRDQIVRLLHEFKDCFAWDYSEMPDADVPKTAFRCPGAVGTFEWVVMPFGLKNAGATYQRAMNAIFHDMIGKFMEIYIDDVVKAVKGQALADFLADHPCLDVEADEEKGINLFSISLVPWKLIFDGSSTETMSGARVVVISPSGLKTQMSFQLDFDCTNNQAEYEALIIGLEMLVELRRSSTKMTPFALTYGHDAVLPMELTAKSLRIAIQHNLQSGEYDEAMMLELEDLEDTRLTALDRLQAQKLKIAKSYNKRVKGKNLVVGDLVWKAILPLGKKDHRFGKWSPNWEGRFRIHEVLRGGAYWLESLDGELHPRKINGIYLKLYYPTVWEARGLESQEAV
ncbi:hypothetical protein SLEP1_g36766 [Rubroshorea leprosula]|uniref:Reverse transcriptase domain-containing protein n=1 Tax=Rubroshorea leprosula TaxID=152421 RepID=A0AAV5KSK9_9ROSI|nr:hypothetical protein SLEP1_g36766 [Rubroshorea leprosula]